MCFDRLIKKILDPFKENSPANSLSKNLFKFGEIIFQSLFKLMFDVVDSIFHNFSRKEKLYAGAKKKERRRRRQTRPINFSPAKFTDDYFSARSLLLSLRLVVEVAPRVSRPASNETLRGSMAAIPRGTTDISQKGSSPS